MTDMFALCLAIASQLDGTIRPQDDTADSAPAGSDIVWIDLANERAGLRVVLRRGQGVERTRVRATMSMTAQARRGADYRETPDLYKLETAAAMSRGADVIARQIESKIVQPAIPMLEAFAAKMAKRDADNARTVSAADRYKAAYPTARVTVKGGDANFFLSRKDGGYIEGDIGPDGSLYIKRISRVPEKAAAALLDILTA